MAATVTAGVPQTGGRLISAFNTVAAIYISIDANSVSYTATAGGLAIDLTTVLNQSAPFSSPINPKDIVGFVPLGLTSGGFIPHTLAVGTSTFVDTVNNEGTLATCPCTIKIQGSGSAASGAMSQIAEGACTQTFSGLLIVNRGGTGN